MSIQLEEICGSRFAGDDPACRCPVCGGESQKVKNITVSSLLKDELNGKAGDKDYYLCLSRDCSVVYFGPNIFRKGDLKVRVWFKEKDHPRPICYCKEVTEKDIFHHIAESKCCSSLQDIQKHTGANTGKECLVKNPTGR